LKFEHIKYPIDTFPELRVVTGKNGRTYTTPKGNTYPSVTTVLSKVLPNDGIEKWKKRVGEAEANRISKRATMRGEAVHSIIEKYLSNEENPTKGFLPTEISNFNVIKTALDSNICKIHGLEVPLYSDFLKVAGRVDCIAEWGRKLSIIDFKNVKKEKKEEYVYNYFLQESVYAYMFFERTNIPITQIVTVISVDESPFPQIFVESSKKYIKDFIDLRKKFND
jgi:hypothetical protein